MTGRPPRVVMTVTPRVGVITGLRLEAACLEAVTERVTIACSGSDSARAEARAQALRETGCSALLSFGLAGGLDPALQPGTLLLPSTVLAPDGCRFDVDRSWHAHVSEAGRAASLTWAACLLAGCERVLADPTDKRALAEHTGAGAVDMESHRVAAVAARHGLPFLVLRVVADPAHHALPRAALAAVRPDGRTDVRAVALSLLRRPWDLAALIRLGRDSERAFASLRRAVPALGASAFGPL